MAAASEAKKATHCHSDSDSDSHHEENTAGVHFVIPPLEELAASLLNAADPIAKRTRCVFYLKHLGTTQAIDAMAKGLSDSSVLLTHEIAFAMGQTKNPHAVPYLNDALRNKSYDPILRHEAAEALGAIGLPESLAILEEFSNDSASEVADTCRLAADRVRWAIQNKGHEASSKYYTVDPAPALTQKLTTQELEKIMCDESLSMFERYRAMFALRDQGDEAAIVALASGFTDKSPVFRHEIAYIYGQLQHPAAAPFLTKVLSNETEHEMVRHEAAEALGSIADESTQELLKVYQRDENLIVKQSCDVALDLMDYWGGSNHAQPTEERAV